MNFGTLIYLLRHCDPLNNNLKNCVIRKMIMEVTPEVLGGEMHF